YETHSHATTYTTAQTAQVEHVPGAQMAKVVLLDVDDRLVMAVVPGDRMVDLDKARSALGASSVLLAGEHDFAPAFPDCEAGAEPPFGPLYDVAMVVDESLSGESITFSAGTHEETITMPLADYLQITHPQRADLVA
ncbi:MAG: aminoacyl-tRNA deacylase, partial [Actinomycetota bacterium]